MTNDPEQTYRAFKEAVNMTSAALDKWLATPESKAVGWKGADGKGVGESVGHAEGRRIVDLLHKSKSALSDDDHAHMAKVVGYVTSALRRGRTGGG